jgi:hypothetical protein
MIAVRFAPIEDRLRKRVLKSTVRRLLKKSDSCFELGHERRKSPLPLFSKEGLKPYRANSPFKKGGQRGI